MAPKALSLDEQLTSTEPEGWTPGLPLLSHQVVARKWMADMESRPIRGGILNDMGLGKTVQAICRVNDSKTILGEAGATLIVCPKAVASNWVSEFNRFTPHLRAILHQGPRRSRDSAGILTSDVVVTTYETLLSEHKNHKASSQTRGTRLGSSPPKQDKKPEPHAGLFRTAFRRIILDEAQVIRNALTLTAAACWDLEGRYRWCLTGVLIHNNVQDVYSLLRFLRAEPFSESKYFRQHSAEAKEFIAPFTLRRNKLDIAVAPLALPAKTIMVVECEMGLPEKSFYDALSSRLSREETEDLGGTDSLATRLRLQQACCHVELVLWKARGEDKSGPKRCHLCQRRLSETHNHVYCSPCAKEVISIVRHAHPVNFKDLVGRPKVPPGAKVRKLLQICHDMQVKDSGSDKVVVFAQWNAYLDIIQYFLVQAGYNFTRYDGSMTSKERERSLATLRDDEDCNIGLFSTKAGGVGLDLATANHVVLMDINWDPAIETQAIDRVHRIGQPKDVTVYKLYVPNTVEDRIMRTQEGKTKVAEDMARQASSEKE